MAGGEAQKRHDPRSGWRYGATGALGRELVERGSDEHQNLELMYRVYGARSEVKILHAYERYLRARAEALVDQHWDHIERLAKALLERETLSGAQAREAMRDPRLKDAPTINTEPLHPTDGTERWV